MSTLVRTDGQKEGRNGGAEPEPPQKEQINQYTQILLHPSPQNDNTPKKAVFQIRIDGVKRSHSKNDL